MRWTERQRAMLREMGIPLWLPEAAPASAENEGAAAPAVSTRVEAGTVVAPALTPRAATVVATPAVTTRTDAAAMPRLRTAEQNATTALPGLAPADWLVVAEPLDENDPQQQQLLDNMLRAIGVALVAPDRERRAVFCALAAGKATPATRAIDQAALQTAIATVAPRCLLAFGKVGAAALLGDDAPLGGLRGSVHRHAGLPVVVTFSLAFLLRHPAEKAKAWADLCLAVGSLAAA
jgi:DNA polymerase